MGRKLLSVVMSIVMVAGLCPGLAYAGERPGADAAGDGLAAAVSQETGQPAGLVVAVGNDKLSSSGLSDLPDSDELLAGYAQQRLDDLLYGSIALGTQSLPDENTLEDADEVLLQELKGFVAEVAAGERSSTAFEIPMANLVPDRMWTAEELGVDAVYDGEHVTAAADAALTAMLPDMDKVVSALCTDCPYQLFWFDKTSGYGYNFNYSITYDGSVYRLGFSFANPYTFRMAVAQEYQGASVYEVSLTGNAASINAAVANAQAIVDAAAGEDVLTAITAYKDAICARVSYNDYAADDANDVAYGNPWQLIWALDDDASTTVVCEGYSKAFQYLCDLSDFQDANCYTVSGTMTTAEPDSTAKTGNHMWNVMRMDDGCNYLVDVTNCDEGTIGYPDELFMAFGSAGSVDAGYTFVANDRDVVYRYDGKTRALLSDEALEISMTEYQPGQGDDPGQGNDPEPGTPIDLSSEGFSVEYWGVLGRYNYYVVEDDDSTLVPEISVFYEDEELPEDAYTVSWRTMSPDSGPDNVSFVDYAGDELVPGSMYFAVITGEEGSGYTGSFQDMQGAWVITKYCLWPYEATLGDEFYEELDEWPYDSYVIPFGEDYGFSLWLDGEKLDSANYELGWYDRAANPDTIYNEEAHAAARLDGKPAQPGQYYACYEGNDPYSEGGTVQFDIVAPLDDAVVSVPAQTYTGSALSPAVTVKLDGSVIASSNYTVKIADASGKAVSKPKAAGAYTVTVTGTGMCTGQASGTFTIERKAATPKVTLSATSYTYNGKAKKPGVTVKVGSTTLTEGADYTVTWPSGRKNAGKYTVKVTLAGNYKGNGSAQFTIKAKAVTPKVTLATTSYTWNGKAKKPAVTVKAGSTVLSAGTDYTVTWPSGRKNVGTYTVKVTLKGNYSGTGSAAFKINPKGTSLSKVTAGSKKLTAKWDKQATKMSSSVVSGYQLQYSTSSTFASGNKTVSVSKYSSTSKTVSNLKASKKYYVRVRTFKTVGGVKYYSPWSAKKAVTTKK